MDAAPCEIPEGIVEKWQEIVNLLAEIVQVPAALIMKFEPPDLVVLVASESKGNPYERDERACTNTGLYCETVMSTRRELLVPDALADELWMSNPDIKLGMISYLGLPLLWPNGEIFGTICVLDDKRNSYSPLYQRLLAQFRELVQADLRSLALLAARLAAETRAKERLEELVAERTAALTAANAQLERDVLDRERVAQARIRLLQQEQAARAAAEAALQMRDDFLSVASHELYTPIASQKLALQSLLREARKSPSGPPKLLCLAEVQSRRLEQIVEALLDVSRLQSGRLELHREEVDLVAIARGVVRRLEAELAQAGCTLLWRVDGPMVGSWDRARLDQVVCNLLRNAMKYGAGQPIEVAVEAVDGRARLVVTDRGIGITPDRLPHIFERFERGVPTKNYGGMGLGLFIAREIVVAHGGSIGVESSPGRGAVFTVDLPRRGPCSSTAAAAPR